MLNLNPRDRLRRQKSRARGRGRAETSFDFYDDWDADETDDLIEWEPDECERLLPSGPGYGAVSPQTQPARQKDMSYAKGRRKSTTDTGLDSTIFSGKLSFFDLLFGTKSTPYRPSAAGLQKHPTSKKPASAAIPQGQPEHPAGTFNQTRRSGTVSSDYTTESRSSRSDMFVSDGDDDAVPLDDEFAMVLERRTTQSAQEAEANPHRSVDAIQDDHDRQSASLRSGITADKSSRRNSSTAQSLADVEVARTLELDVP